MTTTLTLRKHCGRCPRVDDVPVAIEEAVRLAESGRLDAPTPAFRIELDGAEHAKIVYLCETCRTIALRYLGLITKKLEHKSAVRGDVEIDLESEEV